MDHVIAVIPARGGSKGVPKKNIRPLAGRPLISYTIEAAKRAKSVERVIVSTDDAEIARVAKQDGAEVIMRPAELATDEAPAELALIHVVETLKRTEGYAVDVVVTLEPTSPLRSPGLIDRCVETLRRTGADSVVTVVETWGVLGIPDPKGWFTYERNQPRRRQDRAPRYMESGAAYVTKAEILLSQRLICGGKLQSVVVGQDEGVDINTLSDFAIAEALLARRDQRKEEIVHDPARKD